MNVLVGCEWLSGNCRREERQETLIQRPWLWVRWIRLEAGSLATGYGWVSGR